jgi:hypothetical protein
VEPPARSWPRTSMTTDAQTHTNDGTARAVAPGLLLRWLGVRGARLARMALGTLAGGALGFGYYAWIGCATGTCPITSNPVIATLYGALIGGVVAFR